MGAQPVGLDVTPDDNGKALFSTTFNGSGFGGRLMEIDLATDQIAYRGEAGFSGSVSERTWVRPSHDRSGSVDAC